MGENKNFSNKRKMPLKQDKAAEICFVAPEIDMHSNVVLDAKISLVTVTKLTGLEVSGGCECSDKVSDVATIPGDLKQAHRPRSQRRLRMLRQSQRRRHHPRRS